MTCHPLIRGGYARPFRLYHYNITRVHLSSSARETINQDKTVQGKATIRSVELKVLALSMRKIQPLNLSI